MAPRPPNWPAGAIKCAPLPPGRALAMSLGGFGVEQNTRGVADIGSARAMSAPSATATAFITGRPSKSSIAAVRAELPAMGLHQIGGQGVGDVA